MTYQSLFEQVKVICDLSVASSVLHWDQEVMMPPGGATARGRVLSTLSSLNHSRLISKDFLDALIAAERREGGASAESEHAAAIREARRWYDRAIRVPSELVGELAAHGARINSAWRDIKGKQGNFKDISSLFVRSIELTKRFCDCFPEAAHPLDALIDAHDPGCTSAELVPLFESLRASLVPMVKEVSARPLPPSDTLRGEFSESSQEAFIDEVIGAIGFDSHRGYRARSTHPFCIAFSPDDVRITTRYTKTDIAGALFAAIHETGHALYEQGIPREFEGTTLGEAASFGVHESQSRLWENIVGRGESFWRYFYPKLQHHFPEPFGRVDLPLFLRCVNKVQPSLIRIVSDELTYNLHIMVRFELERSLLEGSLQPHELPEAWNALYTEYLGITPTHDGEGVLQDTHWYGGVVGGYFQSYTLGNILSAQLFDAALKEHPRLEEEFSRGNFSTLLGWLRERIHRHGRRYSSRELITLATGRPLTVEPYISYLQKKFSAGGR